MGRYDGEYYDYPKPCSPREHAERGFQMNGSCHVCGCTRDGLIANAVAHLKLLAPQLLAEGRDNAK